MFANFHEICSDLLRFFRKTLQLLEISRFQLDFHHDYTEIYLIFDSLNHIFDLIFDFFFTEQPPKVQEPRARDDEEAHAPLHRRPPPRLLHDGRQAGRDLPEPRDELRSGDGVPGRPSVVRRELYCIFRSENAVSGKA